MIADGNRRGYGLLLDGFWDEARSLGLSLPTENALSAAAFCKARRKITPDLLRQLLFLVHDANEAKFGSRSRWHGRRVFAIDGVKMNLQPEPDLKVAFGVPSGAHCPQILASVLYNVCSKMPVDLQTAPFASCERKHLLAMIPQLQRGDILVVDRGYPSHEVMQALHYDGIDFLIRVPSSNTFKALDAFRDEGHDDHSVIIKPPSDAPELWRALKLRAVRLINDRGEETYFLTTLNRRKFSMTKIRELYHLRWNIEEFYKLAQGEYIGQGQFRSKSPTGCPSGRRAAASDFRRNPVHLSGIGCP